MASRGGDCVPRAVDMFVCDGIRSSVFYGRVSTDGLRHDDVGDGVSRQNASVDVGLAWKQSAMRLGERTSSEVDRLLCGMSPSFSMRMGTWLLLLRRRLIVSRYLFFTQIHSLGTALLRHRLRLVIAPFGFGAPLNRSTFLIPPTRSNPPLRPSPLLPHNQNTVRHALLLIEGNSDLAHSLLSLPRPWLLVPTQLTAQPMRSTKSIYHQW